MVYSTDRKTSISVIYKVKTNFLEYMGLIHCINEYIKNDSLLISKQLSMSFLPDNLKSLFKETKGCKEFYIELTKHDEIDQVKSETKS